MFEFTLLLFVIVPFALLMVAAVYVGLRLRDTQLPPADRDPQLGRKFAILFFQHVAILMVLVAVSMSATEVLKYALASEPNVDIRTPGDPEVRQIVEEKREWFNATQRAAAGLLASGLMYFVMTWVVAFVATNNRTHRRVARAFAVARLMIAGLITMAAGTWLTMFLFQKADDDGGRDYQSLAPVLGCGLVWGPTAMVHLLVVLLARDKRRPAREEYPD